MPFSTADMKVNGFATKGKVLDNPFGGKAVTAYCASLAVCFFHKVTLIQPEVYLGNVLLDIYHIKIICEYLWKDTTQQLLGLHDAKITNTYEIMCMKRGGMQLGFTTDPSKSRHCYIFCYCNFCVAVSVAEIDRKMTVKT